MVAGVSDNFADSSRGASGVIAPARRFAVITPHNSTNLAQMTRGVYVGGLGDVVAVDADGTTCLFSAVPAGTLLPIQVSRINSTSTTATLIVGLY